uniref:Remorin, C-terminal n=1 Tax=Tanacetum cinerariifolium TaxID=118510 RepID=A0A6L2LV24_TANCI|nr:remorin, C-terminal [Tanacetum cinerariifolium]
MSVLINVVSLTESGGIDLKLAVVMGPMALYGNGTSQRQQQQETPSGNLNLSSDLLSGFGAESGEAYLNCRSGSRTLKLSMLQVRFKQEEVKIQAWDSDEKRKSEPEMKRMEVPMALLSHNKTKIYKPLGTKEPKHYCLVESGVHKYVLIEILRKPNHRLVWTLPV